MLWLALALITALSEATKDLISKKAMIRVDHYVSAWSLSAFGTLFLLPLLFIIERPVIGPLFWPAVLVQGIMLTITQVIYMKAIDHSDLSITLPMLAFTPGFMLITSPLILGEFPGVFGILGIIFIVMGAYSLNVSRQGHGLTAPLRALVGEKGPVLMLVVAFVWSITANVDKIGVLNSSPLFYSIVMTLVFTVGLSIVMLLRSKQCLSQIRSSWRALVPIGFFYALGLASQMTAIELALASYVIAIKRTSILFGSLYGFIFFREIKMRQRLTGILIMLIGVMFIARYG